MVLMKMAGEKDGAIFSFYPNVDTRLLDRKRNRAAELSSGGFHFSPFLL